MTIDSSDLEGFGDAVVKLDRSAAKSTGNGVVDVEIVEKEIDDSIGYCKYDAVPDMNVGQEIIVATETDLQAPVHPLGYMELSHTFSADYMTSESHTRSTSHTFLSSKQFSLWFNILTHYLRSIVEEHFL